MPWYAWLIAGLFWTLVLLRLRGRGRGVTGLAPGSNVSEDGPRWNPLGGGGF